MSKPAFSRIKFIDFNEIQLDAPVDIIKGALILDNRQEKLLLQLKLLNISTSMISSVYLSVDSYDDGNDKIHDTKVVEHAYLDLNVNPKEMFGEKNPVFVNDLTRNVKVTITKVVFSNGQVWRNESSETYVKPNQKELTLLDGKLLTYLKERVLDAGYDSDSIKFFPKVVDDKWLCACGRSNKISDNTCVRCGMLGSFILEYKNFESIKLKYDKFTFDQEQEENYRKFEAKKKEEEKLRALSLHKKEKFIKISRLIKKSLVLSLVITILFAGSFTFYRSLKQNSNYKIMVKHYETGDYSEMFTYIDNLYEYKDSAYFFEKAKSGYAQKLIIENGLYESLEIVNEIQNVPESYLIEIENHLKLLAAEEMMGNNDFDEAITLLESIDGYKNSDELKNKAEFNYAVHLYEGKYFKEAKEYFANVIEEYDADKYMDSIYYDIEGEWLNTNKGSTESFYYSDSKVLKHQRYSGTTYCYWSGDSNILMASNGTMMIRMYEVLSISPDKSEMQIKEYSSGELLTFTRKDSN